MKKTIAIAILGLVLIATLLAGYYYKPFVDKQACVGCGDCVKNCPVNAIEMKAEKAEIIDSTCIDCKQCVKTCPYSAIRTGK